MGITCISLSVLPALWSCGDFPPLGGPCTYADTPGIATIISVEPADPDDLNCWNDPVVVIFDFQPADPADDALAAAGIQLRISEGVNPPADWVESEGLTVGSAHACLRRDITAGTCTPLLFEFTEVDYQAGIDACYADTTFAMAVFPQQVAYAISSQLVVVLVAVEEPGPVPVGEPVGISASTEGWPADVTISPAAIVPGEVAEVTVVPADWPATGTVMEGRFLPEARRFRRYPCAVNPPTLRVHVCGTRGDCQRLSDVTIGIHPGQDELLEAASKVRDRFIPYLAENYPEFGITEDTHWTGTIVKPHYLVVSHYLFFSEEWEMGVMWHIMIPPYDWAKIYLRHRTSNFQPQAAFEISSLSADPPLDPVPIEPPPQVDR